MSAVTINTTEAGWRLIRAALRQQRNHIAEFATMRDPEDRRDAPAFLAQVDEVLSHVAQAAPVPALVVVDLDAERKASRERQDAARAVAS